MRTLLERAVNAHGPGLDHADAALHQEPTEIHPAEGDRADHHGGHRSARGEPTPLLFAVQLARPVEGSRPILGEACNALRIATHDRMRQGEGRVECDERWSVLQQRSSKRLVAGHATKREAVFYRFWDARALSGLALEPRESSASHR